MKSLDHFLVVTEPEPDVREYEIEHDDKCPVEEHDFGGDFTGKHEPMTYDVHVCDVGDLVLSIGIEDAVVDIKELAPGRYPLRTVVEHTPSLPTNGGEEWDVWLEADVHV